MWEVVFNVADIRLLLSSLAFSIPWLVLVVFLARIASKINKVAALIGKVFVAIGVGVNLLSIYFFISDKHELESKAFHEVVGKPGSINLDPRNASFTVGELSFKGGNYKQWIVPDNQVIAKVGSSSQVRVRYVPKAEHGVWPPGNKILQIDVCCAP
ncbi:hypothetical protein KJY73_12670 [Bowmanella sp. Y26]|uniref:hypothetical protein n=1 Tax=Bowmanella yangjiangensis TaxID=2811230 RepID=UPI001BDCB885|nr:hypothetical protein [Bowmanella yangjiangensis]MBT1064436.1 hypothetical protein [Bowmanella yangjiangensis]